jgi:hypothetical protein
MERLRPSACASRGIMPRRSFRTLQDRRKGVVRVLQLWSEDLQRTSTCSARLGSSCVGRGRRLPRAVRGARPSALLPGWRSSFWPASDSTQNRYSSGSKPTNFCTAYGVAHVRKEAPSLASRPQREAHAAQTIATRGPPLRNAASGPRRHALSRQQPTQFAARRPSHGCSNVPAGYQPDGRGIYYGQLTLNPSVWCCTPTRYRMRGTELLVLTTEGHFRRERPTSPHGAGAASSLFRLLSTSLP